MGTKKMIEIEIKALAEKMGCDTWIISGTARGAMFNSARQAGAFAREVHRQSDVAIKMEIEDRAHICWMLGGAE